MDAPKYLPNSVVFGKPAIFDEDADLLIECLNTLWSVVRKSDLDPSRDPGCIELTGYYDQGKLIAVARKTRILVDEEGDPWYRNVIEIDRRYFDKYRNEFIYGVHEAGRRRYKLPPGHTISSATSVINKLLRQL